MEPEALDHFLLYELDPRGVNFDNVMLAGQFDTERGPQQMNLKIRDHIANPVSKNGAEIMDENAHFTMYLGRSVLREPERTVTIENQFGPQVLRIGNVIADLNK